MSHTLQDTIDIIENFKSVMEEMQKKVTAMRERTDEAYRKINQLEAQKYSLIDTNDQLSKELRKLSYEVSLYEDRRLSQDKISELPKKKAASRETEASRGLNKTKHI